jgi:hypothetical protein
MIIRKTSLLLLLNCTHAFQSSPLHALALGPCKRRQASISGGETALPSTNTDEIDLYNSNNEEVPIDFTDFMKHDGEKIDEAIKDEGELMSFDDGVDDTTVEDGSSKKLIECQASITLPFSAEVAFDAFSDLTRQP